MAKMTRIVSFINNDSFDQNGSSGPSRWLPVC